MQLEELIRVVESSSADDWHTVDVPVLHGWEYGTMPGDTYIRPIEHHNCAVLRSDIDVSIAYGAVHNENFSASWTEKFGNNASAVRVVLRYRGVPVRSWLHVYADDCRYLLPIPHFKNGEYVVPRENVRIGRLMFAISDSAGFARSMDDAFEECGVRVET